MSFDVFINRFTGWSMGLGSRAYYISGITRSNLKWYRLRWLLPLLFVGGYIVTLSSFDPVALEYLGLTVLSIFACSLLLTRLNPPFVNKLPIWIILGVFMVAYYFKFYLMVFEPEVMTQGLFRRLYWIVNSPEILLDTYATMTYAFVVFCLTAWWLLVYAKNSQTQTFKREINYRRVISVLMWLVPLLMVVTTVTMYITGIAIMAAESVYLSFRLAGWVFYIRVMLIPALLLLLIWCSDKAGLRKHLGFGVLLLFLHGLSDILLRSSRGSLLVMFIVLALLFMVTERITKKRAGLFGVILLLTILLWPVISAYRWIRAGGYPISMGSALSEAMDNISMSFFEILSESFRSVLFRFTGADSLLPIIGAGVQPVGTSAFNISVTKFVTVEIFGFPPDVPMGVAPSLLGWFYIVGGNYLVVIGMFCFVLLAWVTWRILLKSRLRCLPVAQALFLFWVFTISSEGVLERQYLNILVIVGSIALCEWLTRTVGGTSVSKNVGKSRGKDLRDASRTM